MRNLTTLFAVLTLTLMSCKKEKPLQQSITFHAVIEVNADKLNYTSQSMYKNGDLLDSSSITTYNFRDTLIVEVKNTSFSTQYVGIELTINNSFIKSTAKDSLESGETLTLKHIF